MLALNIYTEWLKFLYIFKLERKKWIEAESVIELLFNNPIYTAFFRKNYIISDIPGIWEKISKISSSI